MRLETLSNTSKSIGNTKRESKIASGWRHGGEEFVILVDSLKSEIEKDLQQHGLHVNMSLCHLFVGSPLILGGIGMCCATL
ncbi:uncharacterized protein N7518_007114 [Penicillium psychrosexuale]|uniref:uncharacterized protein n=1 Tax=Penicillium psychrosexuale TaxID=1002107 RepID=UPI0025451EF5|nr:uncharacterized protein N7518_007114 [Penicillium psychrosexuale]KAJ5790103.1 hypothetical protein N7518_007114 [Penicillium psychrosexuale]